MKAREVAAILLLDPDANVVFEDVDGGFICVIGMRQQGADANGDTYISLATDETVSIIQPARLVGR